MTISHVLLVMIGSALFVVSFIVLMAKLQQIISRFSKKPDHRPANGWMVKVRKGTYDRLEVNYAANKKNVSWKIFFRALGKGWLGDIKAPSPYTRIDTYYVPDELILDPPDSFNGGIRFYRHPGDTTTVVTVLPENIHLIERRYIDCAEYCLDPRVPRNDCAIVTAVTAESPDQAAAWLPIFRQYRFGWLERFWLGRLLSKQYSRWTPVIQHILENNPELRRMVNARYIRPVAALLQKAKNQSGLNRTFTYICVLFRYAIGVCNVRLAIAFQRS